MKDYMKRVHATRNKAWEDAKAVLDAASAEGRDLTAEEDQKWTRLNEAISSADARLAELLDVEEREAAAESARERFAALGTGSDEERQGAPSDEDTLRRIGRGELRGHSFQAEARDLTVGSATAGGNTVPTSFRAQLMEHMIESSSIRQTGVTVLTTSSGESIQIPKTTSFSTASLVSEAAAISESDPAFGQVTLDAFKYALLIQVSRELVEDTAIPLIPFLAAQAGRAIGNASGAHFTTGDGSSKPNGLVTAATTGVTGGTGQTGIPTANELIDLKYSVIAPYRRNAVWQMSDQTLAEVRKLQDGNSQYLWQPGLVLGAPDHILGHRLVNNPDVADAALSAKSVVFGDHSKYVIRDVNSVEVARSEDYAFANDLVTFRFVFRTDGDLVDTTGAVKVYVGGAS